MGSYKIPPLIWIIFGLGISIYSKIVGVSSSSKVMNIFFYIGLFFLAIGVFKILIKYVFLKSKVNKLKVREHTPEKTENNSSKSKFQIINCSRCDARNYTTYNYCHNCGFKLR